MTGRVRSDKNCLTHVHYGAAGSPHLRSPPESNFEGILQHREVLFVFSHFLQNPQLPRPVGQDSSMTSHLRNARGFVLLLLPCFVSSPVPGQAG